MIGVMYLTRYMIRVITDIILIVWIALELHTRKLLCK